MGLCIGSFLNVCIYRLPRKESIVFPGSHCTSCGAGIRFVDNVPLLSYLFLRGRCRNCGEKISLQYPLVELLTGLLFLVLFRKFGLSLPFAAYGCFTAALIAVSVIDLEHRIIPDVISVPGIPIGFLASLSVLPIGWKASLIGLGVGGGLLFVIAVASRGGMGGGDIKLLAMIGAFLGWKSVLITLMLGSLLGTLVSLPLMALGLKGRKDMIPFGPFLAIGGLVSLLYEREIIEFYFSISKISVTGPSF